MVELSPTLFICTTCNAPGVEDAHGAGRALCTLAQNDAALLAVARVQPLCCIGGCSQPCTISVSAPGGCTYIFGGLKPEAATLAALRTYLVKYRTSANGFVPQAERPAGLKTNILFRLPPSGWESDDGVFK